MKKILVQSEEHLKDCISKLKEMGYAYSFGPSENAKFIILEGNKMRFEYGDDVYECNEFTFNTKNPLREKLSDWDFSEHTHTREEFKSENGNTITIDHLRKGNSNMEYVRFVNDDYGLSVFGDFGNWIFCRPFLPSKEGYVCVSYWNEKLKISSYQDHAEYDAEETEKEINELINTGLEEYGYEGEELVKAKEWFTDLLLYVEDEIEYIYHAFRFANCPFDDLEDVPYAKKGSCQLLVVFDAFNEICNRYEAN